MFKYENKASFTKENCRISEILINDCDFTTHKCIIPWVIIACLPASRLLSHEFESSSCGVYDQQSGSD